MNKPKMKVVVVDNKNLEDKLTLGKQHDVEGECTGDFFEYYLLLCDDGKQHWIEKYRVAEGSGVIKFETPTPLNLPYGKPVENIVELPFPSDTSPGIDLYRVQYISPLDKGSYELTMGWMEKVKLTEDVYPRAKIMALWKSVRNK